MKLNMKDFVDLVAQMREKQKFYFKTRDRQVMLDSKRLESEVDKMLEKFRMAEDQLPLYPD